jgi:type I restriction enzyme S subunit
VAALERVEAALKRYRAAVLKAAVEGKLTADWRARHPAEETGAQLLRRILDERRRRWEQEQIAKYAAADKQLPKGWQAKYKEPTGPETSGLPELPGGWCWAKIEQVIQRSEYGTSVKCDYKADGPPVLRIPNIAAGRIDLADLKRATVPLTIAEGDALEAGDLLVCRTNGSIALIGKAALVPDSYSPPHYFASYLLRFRFAEPKNLPRWVHIVASSIFGRRFIESNAASSAGQHNISLSLMHSMPLPLPPPDEQQAIEAEVERRMSIVEEVEAQIEADLKRAARLRQSILKRAFEGRLVPQDPRDEPAEKLLERIRQERETAGNGKHPARRAAGKRCSPAARRNGGPPA